jgi:hypothetical protein
MNTISVRRMLAVSALVGLVAALPAAAVSKGGFVRLDGIAGDAGDSQHQGWFQSGKIDFGGLVSGMSIPVGGGTFSFDLARDGAGFAALVRACLGRQRIPTAELAIGSDRYELAGVTVEMITVGTKGSGMATAGPIVVSLRYQSIRDPRTSVPSTGRMGAGVVAPKSR